MPAEPFDRRSFLTGTAVTVGSLLTACTGDDDAATETPASSAAADASGWEGVRAQFSLDPDIAHFAAFVLAGHPQRVQDAIERWRAALDTDTEQALLEGAANEQAARTAAARYLEVDAADIALTDSTTMGLGLTYQGLALDPGDHVLTSTHDFYSTHESLRLAAVRTGAEVERITLYDDPAGADTGAIVARVRAALRPSTRVVALTWVHSSTGVKLPVRRIADMLAEHYAGGGAATPLLCLDAVHGFGVEDAGPGDLGCDVFITGTHKWLFGPRGTGLVWASSRAARLIRPIIPPFSAEGFTGWLDDEPVGGPFGTGATPGGYHTFEHRWAVAEAFGFHRDIGRSEVAARTRELATRLKEGIAELRGVRLVTPIDAELSAGIVCCDVAGHAPFDVIETLRREHDISASVTPYREPYVRLGPSIVTDAEQVDAAVSALAALG